jgi:hypothetical protein
MTGLTKGGTEKPDQHRTRSWWRRPRVRLSVRAMMILVLVLGGGLGWVVRRAHVQRDAIALIEEAGGTFIFDDQVDADGFNRPYSDRMRPSWQQWIMYAVGDDYVRRACILFLYPRSGTTGEETWRAMMNLDDLVALHLDAVDLDDAHLVALLGRFPDLRCLDIMGSSRVTDAGLAPLRRLHQLRFLDIRYTGIDDAGMAHLERLSRLQSLDLGATRVTDSGLARLRGLDKLEDLTLGGTQVGDAGLAHLRDLHKIRTLMLDDTRVTDSGLEHLAGLTALECLSLSNTDVSDAGLAHLSKLDRIWGLYLDGTRVSNVSLPYLKRLNRIQHLSLSGSHVSVGGIMELKAAHPSANIK